MQQQELTQQQQVISNMKPSYQIYNKYIYTYIDTSGRYTYLRIVFNINELYIHTYTIKV